MEKNYTPKDIESKLYQWWEKSGFFKPKGDGPSFSIVIPPPNVTGVLHIGHALNHTLQDISTRIKRMQGYRTCWLPGTDHAGIATQNVVEKALKKDDHKSRHDIGREAFVDKVWDWKSKYGDHITNQIRTLGQSVDWSKERFTMDDGLQNAVLDHFIKLHKEGLIYRGKRIINWCPRCHTALSDIEVTHQDVNGHLWHIAYTAEDGTEIVVATTRPETMFGDTAIAVHPDDSRYAHLLGKTIRIPLTDRDIPIVADEHVDPTFGTGAVKVTPAHDPNDFEIGQRHNLDQILIMDEKGVMNENVPKEFQGLDRFKCRKVLITQLEERSSLKQTDDHALSRGHCYRCDTVIEPYLSNQWFVDMKQLAQPALEAVKSGDITFHPKDRWDKLYLDWMENIRDWCISRQIWWGHRIPVYYKKDNPEEFIVSKTPPDNPDDYFQDEDVLDTWFSSALWPFSTFGWPNETQDLKDFYPTALLITGYDIITFWVSRMITMGLHEMKEIPFKDVYIHGLIRDMDGRKMSKSLGNAIDPLELADQYGADALRYGLSSLATLGGQDMKLSESKIESSRNFANKVWNVTRYIFMILEESDQTIIIPNQAPNSDNPMDQWITSKFHNTLKEFDEAITQFNYAKGADLLWEFIWNQFCDWYIEATKTRKEAALPTLTYILLNSIKVLHPMMPFITDHIYQELKNHPKLSFETDHESIMISEWPKVQESLINPELEGKSDLVFSVIREIRNLRKEIEVPPSKNISLTLVTDSPDAISERESLIKTLAKAETLTIQDLSSAKPDKAKTAVVSNIEIYIPLDGLIDLDKEKAKLEKSIQALQSEIQIHEKKLNNKGFTGNAPKEVVDAVQAKVDEAKNKTSLLEAQIKAL